MTSEARVLKSEDFEESKEARESVIDRIEVLDRVKDLLLLPNTEYATTEQVASYYEVDKTAIRQITKRNNDELSGDGIKNMSGSDIRKMYNTSGVKTERVQGGIVVGDERIMVAYSENSLYSIDAILRIAFYLSDSDVATSVRETLLFENPSLYHKLSNVNLIRVKKYEQDMEYFLRALFGNEFVECQVRCGKYLLDFLVHDIIHIEVDENGHSGYDEGYEEARESYILNSTNYYTFRFNPHKDSRFSLVVDIIDLFDNIGYPEELEFKEV